MSVSGRPPRKVTRVGPPRAAPRSLSTHAQTRAQRGSPPPVRGCRPQGARGQASARGPLDQPPANCPLFASRSAGENLPRFIRAPRTARPAPADPAAVPRSLSWPQRALDTALRMARTENATLVPVRLERESRCILPMDASARSASWRKRSPASSGVRGSSACSVDPTDRARPQSTATRSLRTLTNGANTTASCSATGLRRGVEFTRCRCRLGGRPHVDGEIVVVAAERPRRPTRSAFSYSTKYYLL
jgi:hypothetical protein